jgi:hypothetical protein
VIEDLEEEQEMRAKLDRQNEKETRLEAIEKEFVDWADRKETQIRSKL